ncbi:MAG: hypothetical protein ACLGIA_04645 [Actinomycetes bacterium]
MSGPETGISITVGPVEIDVPQSLGYYAGLGAAVAFGVLDPPVALFIATIPVFKMLGDEGNPQPVRFVGQLLQGAGKPVGSDGQGTVRLVEPRRAREGVGRAVRGITQTALTPVLTPVRA